MIIDNEKKLKRLNAYQFYYVLVVCVDLIRCMEMIISFRVNVHK